MSALAEDTSTTTATPAMQAKPARTLSVDEMKTESTAIVDKSHEAMRYLLFLKEQAKKQKDLIKLNCINDKLVKMKAQVNLTESTNNELQGALSNGSDERFALYTRLGEDSNAVQVIKDEGTACVGATELYKQESGVTVERPEVPDDPSKDDPFFEEVEPPGYASPFN